MTSRASVLVERLKLSSHPEGGFFRQVYQSTAIVMPPDDRGPRAALTTIYFLLVQGQVSRWHRVLSDEVWHFYEGAPLELLVVTPDFAELSQHHLGPVGDETSPVHTVRAGWWQAARPTGEYSLVGCTVAPGFDFSDFALAAEDPGWASALSSRHAEGAAFV